MRQRHLEREPQANENAVGLRTHTISTCLRIGRTEKDRMAPTRRQSHAPRLPAWQRRGPFATRGATHSCSKQKKAGRPKGSLRPQRQTHDKLSSRGAWRPRRQPCCTTTASIGLDVSMVHSEPWRGRGPIASRQHTAVCSGAGGFSPAALTQWRLWARRTALKATNWLSNVLHPAHCDRGAPTPVEKPVP